MPACRLLAFARLSPPLAVLREFAVSPPLVAGCGLHWPDYDLLGIVHALFSFSSTVAWRWHGDGGCPYIVPHIGQCKHWSLRPRSSAQSGCCWADRTHVTTSGELSLFIFTSDAERREAAFTWTSCQRLPFVAAAGA